MKRIQYALATIEQCPMNSSRVAIIRKNGHYPDSSCHFDYGREKVDINSLLLVTNKARCPMQGMIGFAIIEFERDSGTCRIVSFRHIAGLLKTHSK